MNHSEGQVDARPSVMVLLGNTVLKQLKKRVNLVLAFTQEIVLFIVPWTIWDFLLRHWGRFLHGKPAVHQTYYNKVWIYSSALIETSNWLRYISETEGIWYLSNILLLFVFFFTGLAQETEYIKRPWICCINSFTINNYIVWIMKFCGIPEMKTIKAHWIIVNSWFIME